MSHPQPGPYGPPPIPPQQPNPYAQGYPQQPAAGGWGPPQAPGPYGPYPPQGGGGKGKAVAITIGALLVVGAIVGGVLFFTGDGDSGGNGGGGDNGGGVPAKMAAYTIEMPQTLLDGKYTKNTSLSSSKDTEDLSNDPKAKEFGILNGTGKKASYENAEKQRLKVTAIYGELADPAKTVDALFADMERAQAKYKDRIETVTETTAYRPAGFDGVSLKCKTQRVKSTLSSLSVSDISTCIWGDGSAAGVVEHRVVKSSGGIAGATTSATGDVMSAKELSEATAKVRNEVRKEK
ncbi:hypothetical protein [Streptomyces cinnamoneus]|uniref:Uncharacterized protein n=1 Tax=Streptomyces cinnamoneus TaxID=53446 RepID=A0A918TK75_STRCJ|nr:hypothetical protein [Streptomyces cinnamoneus]GHC50813.1 hypothetical protein GCM10010507_28330 [Streptomyces cinnamoneus]